MYFNSSLTVVGLLLTFIAAGTAPVAAEGPPTVTDFGATGDGVTDDSQAFEKGLNAAGLLLVPKGHYRVTRQLRIKAGGGLIGAGTLLIEFGISTSTSTHDNVALLIEGDDARIEGVSLERKFVDGSYGIGIQAERRTGVRIRGVEISGYSARYGISLIECTGFEITHCSIHDFMVNTTADMIRDSPAAIRVTRSVRGVIHGNILDKIEVGPAGRASISPLVPAYCPQVYQSDHLTLLQCRNITISSNVLSTSGEGIDMILSESCTLTGNVIRDIWAQGIKMLEASFCTVSSNQLSDCYSGIGLDGGGGRHAYGNTITGNVIRNTGSPGSFGLLAARTALGHGTWAVVLDAASDYNAVVHNVLLDTQAVKTMNPAGIRDNRRPNNKIQDNLISRELTYSSSPP